MRGSYFNTIETKLTAYYKDNKIKELNDSYIIIKILSLDENRINKQLYLYLKNKLENIYISHDSFESLLQLFNDSKSTLDLNKLRAYDTLKIFDAIHFNELLAKDEDLIINAITKNENIIIKNYRDIIKYLPSWLDIEFFDDNKSFNNLSTGEKTFFRLQISLLYQISNLKDTLYNTINIFLDEIELTLHPLWQKKILQELIFSISKINTKKINLFFITHSPFILSDVPKENVIFLEKGKQVYPNIETFGANIHTLLSHGFFMKDGLMGEFAKGKIEDVINYLNDKESTIKDNDEAQKLLNIIGEPIIKNQLQRMLDSKRLSKVDEIDKIKSDMKSLAKRLEELEK
ncbi:MAG: hypothetical protein C0627_09210 [Sulfurimonas sp.]|nr:MAG: hypothetical protein C0627_09210 [Sulfurimonas sp.]